MESELPPRIRAFIALRLGPQVRQAVEASLAELRGLRDGVGWVRAANLHLTLRFLGDAVDSRMLPPLVERLRAIAGETAPFTVLTRGIGGFPNLLRPRVIWIGLESIELMALAARVEAAAVEVGFASERRPFSPHLTIGRVRNLSRFGPARRALERLAGRDFGQSMMGGMTLYRSMLAPEGATYIELARIAFGRR